MGLVGLDLCHQHDWVYQTLHHKRIIIGTFD